MEKIKASRSTNRFIKGLLVYQSNLIKKIALGAINVFLGRQNKKRIIFSPIFNLKWK
jgi:hypothetical protein